MLFPASLSFSVSSTWQGLCSLLAPPCLGQCTMKGCAIYSHSCLQVLKWTWVLELCQAKYFHITIYALGNKRLQKVTHASSHLSDTFIPKENCFLSGVIFTSNKVTLLKMLYWTCPSPEHQKRDFFLILLITGKDLWNHSFGILLAKASLELWA